MKKQGTLEVWNYSGNGIIAIRHEDFRIEKFFLPYASIILCEPTIPHRGCIVLFDVSLRKTRPGGLPLAIEAEIFKPKTARAQAEALAEEQARAAEATAETAQEGRPGGAL